MSANPVSHSPPVTDPEHSRADRALSIAATGLAWAVLFATYFLISPIQHATYPGHKPWRPGSMLHQITDAMALGNVLETFRGVEIKSLALFAACTVAFALLATRFALRRHEIHFARHARQSWFHAQTLWFLWIALSFFSAYWSVSPDIAIGQSTIYALQFGLAVGFGWLIRHRDFPRVETALLVIPSLGAALCIWYYFERNSLHRPGFPIGNPSTLAACTAPAIAIAVVRVWRWCHDGLVGKRRRPAGAAVLALVMLIPLVWCIRLTWSRAAIVSLVVGLVTLIFLQLRSRFRWVFVGVCSAGVIGALFWYALISSQDASNIRGATLRYRYYTWRYAAEMWQSRPGSGIGAGAFPQFAGERAATDRALDPGAFLGETITHAHNELFEIFAEIGLVGGVTWVGGVIATVFAALGVIRRRGPQHDDSWRALALLLAFVVIMTDAMFGVSLRLPGVPALLALVVGMIWAHAKAGNAENPESILDVIDSRAQPATYRTALISLGCAIASGASGWVSVIYARSAAAEAAAAVALRNDDFQAA
ncbi:MAG: O-antigen ligase family protein, partial [Phycisphaerae bacterium]